MERTFAMVHEAFRQFRHVVAEIDLDQGELSQTKVENHYARISQRHAESSMKEIYRIISMEGEPGQQVNGALKVSYL